MRPTFAFVRTVLTLVLLALWSSPVFAEAVDGVYKRKFDLDQTSMRVGEVLVAPGVMLTHRPEDGDYFRVLPQFRSSLQAWSLHVRNSNSSPAMIRVAAGAVQTTSTAPVGGDPLVENTNLFSYELFSIGVFIAASSQFRFVGEAGVIGVFGYQSTREELWAVGGSFSPLTIRPTVEWRSNQPTNFGFRLSLSVVQAGGPRDVNWLEQTERTAYFRNRSDYNSGEVRGIGGSLQGRIVSLDMTLRCEPYRDEADELCLVLGYEWYGVSSEVDNSARSANAHGLSVGLRFAPIVHTP